MDKDNPPKRHGVFKPVGHLVISFPPETDLDEVERSLAPVASDITRYTAAEMWRQIENDMESAGTLASVGQEMNLIKAHLELAKAGFVWLVVRADDDDQARAIADIAKRAGAERAQHYGRFIIEELIHHGDEPTQMPESPDHDLDARTPSGQESERAERHRRDS